MAKEKYSYLRTLQGKLNMCFLLIVAIAVVSFMMIFIVRSKSELQTTSMEYTGQLLQMVNENIDSYIVNMENIAEIVMDNTDVKYFLLTKESEEGLKNVFGLGVQEQFKTLKETRNDIYNIGILCDNGTYMINDKDTIINPYADVKSLDWYKRALEGEEVITSSHVQNIVKDEYPWVVTLSQEIDLGESTTNRAVLFIDLNYSTINSLCEKMSLGESGYVFILDEEGTLVYHPRQQLVYSGFWEENLELVSETEESILYSQDEERIYSIVRSEVTGWTIVGVTYVDELLEGMNRDRITYYVMAIILIGIAMTLAVAISGMITQPIHDLRNSMRQVEKGDFEFELVEPNTGDEISGLIRSFNIMVRKIHQLIEKNNQEQEEKRKSELNALQAQINPHFLYNTLDSIIWMAEDGNTRDVVLMTSALAKLFRKSISNRNEMIMLSEEIDYTRSYLTIQKMRYKDKLEYEIDVDPMVSHIEVIKLIVQPLVENAIYHGIKYKEDGKGTIRVESAYAGDKLEIKVIDNGIGMSKEALEHIFDERVTDRHKNGVGVLNVHRRIQLHYGMAYGLSFESEVGVGTTVTITLPLEREDIEGRTML